MTLTMEENLQVIGDGKTVYKFEGITNNPDNVWDAEENYPGGFKISNAVKGTRIKDLGELVGGMGAGTDVVLVARDGFETKLPYSSIYTDPSVQERQGDAILAWWADGKYVPDYADGMRLFFTPGGDHVYGQWDMHETLPESYWHYYYGDGVMYPSCAGLSAKWITEIRIYSIPQGDWTLELDGQDLGGLSYDVSKTYFESALVCQFGANHKASYTDSQGRVWEGMPLWFLAGFVDDADQHSNNAFNEKLAVDGYQVIITAKDGSSVMIDSADIIRNNDYIVANSLNGALIPESDSSWPLRLVGPAVSGATSIKQIGRIELVKDGGAAKEFSVVIKLTVGSKKAAVDGRSFTLDVAPKINAGDGKTMVPLRFVSQALGAEVRWDSDAGQVTVIDKEREILLTTGSNRITINGVPGTIDCAPVMVPPGRILVSLQFFGQALGDVVIGENEAGEITISR